MQHVVAMFGATLLVPTLTGFPVNTTLLFSGIGTILSGLKAEKPLVLMARRAALGEHRNDHQLATVAQLGRIPGIHIVEDAEDLRACLSDPALLPMTAAVPPALERMIAALRTEIFGRS